MANHLPKDVQAALDRMEPELRQAFLDAIARSRSAVSLQKVEAALIAGNIEGAIDALRLEGVWFSSLQDAVRSSLNAGGALALTRLRVRDPYDGTTFVLGFDGRHDRAEAWVRERSSALITEIVEDQREMARQQIKAGLEAGRNPRQTALDIVGRINRATGKREGGFIGLTSQQAAWVRNAEAQLRNLDAEYFTRGKRDKRYDATVRKAIKDGKPLADADVQKIMSRYKERLLKYRADVIARTESLNAMRAGAYEGYQQLVDSGRVRADQVTVTWSATMDGRTRDHHRSLNGTAIQFGEFFNPEPGVFMLYPGDLEHSTDPKALARETIQCRCVALYRIKSDLMR